MVLRALRDPLRRDSRVFYRTAQRGNREDVLVVVFFVGLGLLAFSFATAAALATGFLSLLFQRLLLGFRECIPLRLQLLDDLGAVALVHRLELRHHLFPGSPPLFLGLSLQGRAIVAPPNRLLFA